MSAHPHKYPKISSSMTDLQEALLPPSPTSISKTQKTDTESSASLLKENYLYTLKKLLGVLITQIRMRALGVAGAKIYPEAGAVIGEASGPAHTIAACIPKTLKQEVVKEYKGYVPWDFILCELTPEEFTTLREILDKTPHKTKILQKIIDKINIAEDTLESPTPTFERLEEGKEEAQPAEYFYTKISFSSDEACELQSFLIEECLRESQRDLSEKLVITNHNTDHYKKAYALYRFTMIASLIFTTPFSLLVFFMPEVYRQLGNEALRKVELDCRILAIPPLATAITSTNAVFTDMLTSKRKTYHPLLAGIFQEAPMVTAAFVGWYTNSFLTIALGQLVFSLVGSYVTYRNVSAGLKEMGCTDELSLTWQEKKDYLKIMLKGLPAAIGDSAVREILIFSLGHKKDPEAPISFYFILYQIFFTTYAFVKPIAETISYGGNLKEYAKHRKTNERGVMAAATMTSVLFGISTLAAKDHLIPFLNSPSDQDEIEANKMTSKWYLLLFFGILIQGAALTQMDKMSNILERRLLAGALDNIPQIILLLTSLFTLSAEHMVIGLLMSWIFGDMCTILCGLCLGNTTNKGTPESVRIPTTGFGEAQSEEKSTLPAFELTGRVPSSRSERSERSDSPTPRTASALLGASPQKRVVFVHEEADSTEPA
jgi:hypothetical protein